jgi:hypothetical protein
MTRTTVRTMLAVLGFLTAAHMARAADTTPVDGAVCTTRTEIRTDGAIVTHKVCTYILRNAR